MERHANPESTARELCSTMGFNRLPSGSDTATATGEQGASGLWTPQRRQPAGLHTPEASVFHPHAPSTAPGSYGGFAHPAGNTVRVPPPPPQLSGHLGFGKSQGAENRAKASARLDLEVSAGWASPASRGLWGWPRFTASTRNWNRKTY